MLKITSKKQIQFFAVIIEGEINSAPISWHAPDCYYSISVLFLVNLYFSASIALQKHLLAEAKSPRKKFLLTQP